MTLIAPSDWLVSVDDHVIEPPRVWLDRLPARLHDRAPRMAKGDRGAVWQYEDKIVHTAGLSVAAGKAKEEFSLEPVSFDEMRPGAYDPVERIKDMDRVRAYNDWMLDEWCATAPGRFIPLVIIPHSDTTWPDCIEVATALVKDLPKATPTKILRGNAERLYRFTPVEPAIGTV